MEKQSIFQKKRKKRGFSQKYITKFLLLFFFIACSNAAFGSKRTADQATADYINGVNDWKSSNNWRTEPYFIQTVKEGYIEFIVPVYRTYKEAGMTYHDGFYAEEGWLEIKIENCSKTYIVEDNSLLIKNGTIVTTYAPVYYSNPNAPSTEYSFITFKVPLLNSMLSTSLSITYSGRWTINGLYYDDTFKNKSKSIDTSTPTKMSQVSTTSSFSVLDNMPVIAVTWTKTESGDCNLGDYAIYNGTTLLGTKTASTNSGTFNIPYDKIDINQANTLKIKRILAQLTVESGSVEVKAFPQLKSQSFKAAFNNQTRKIDLTWEIPIPSGNYDNSVFKISEANGYLTDTEKTKSYSSTTSIYTHSIDVPETVENRDYSFTITRDWGTTFNQTATLSNVSGKHISLTVVQDTVELDNALSKATVKWTTEGYVWSPGSELRITRIKNSSFTDIIKITDSDAVRSGKYEDKMIQICNQYRYELQIIPGSSNYKTKDKMVTLDFVPTRIGRITNITASKGYYSNRIELSWQVEGVFNNFSVLRKEYNQDDSQYKQIITVTASGTQTQYNIDDLNAVPGVVYSYKIVGYVSCGGETKESLSNPTDIGFRTPTGDIYGRVTFTNGQAVSGVEVRLESENMNLGKSYKFDGTGKTYITNDDLLKTAVDSVTIQALIKPESLTQKGYILQKPGMYELSIDNQKLKFKVGSDSIVSDSLKNWNATNEFVQISAVAEKGSLNLYINGKLNKNTAKTSTNIITGNKNKIILGSNFKGYMDEIRIWNRAMKASEIAGNFDRYLTGGEKDLLAYYNLNFAVDSNFYDMSFAGTVHNGNHGTSTSTKTESVIVPTAGQLSYKAVTKTDGSYAILSVPYSGNGTAYSIIPKLGAHSFEPVKDVRFLGLGAQSHTVNFVDKSSFEVSGTVYYKGGSIPVQGVNFKIDGIIAMNKDIPVSSAANGTFKINVPIGVHEVKAVKANHVFVNDGRLTTVEGYDINYQDILTGREIIDSTTVRFIGRVAGGPVQEAFPLGHSLSKNNLGDSLAVKFTYEGNYTMMKENTMVTYSHLNPAYKNSVYYKEKTIIIIPDKETGEFIADVIPEKFTVNVTALNYENNFLSNNYTLDLTNSFLVETSSYTHTDTIKTPDGKKQVRTITDEVKYNKAQKFIALAKPTLEVLQLNNGTPVEYFGEKETDLSTPEGTIKTPLYNIGADKKVNYLLGLPVFANGKTYSMKASIFEEYVYYNKSGNVVTTKPVDRVPSQGASVDFLATMNNVNPVTIDCDSAGTAYYTFKDTVQVDIVSALAKFAVSGSIKKDGDVSYISWLNSFNDNVITLGSSTSGTNFVTQGPNKMLTVLRDPPGSKSFAYLEKGTSFSHSEQVNGETKFGNSYDLTNKLNANLITFTGVAVGTIQSVESATGFTLGVKHEETYTGSNTKSSTSTITTRFQTSDDPQYVGADADTYIGYSTNMNFGTNETIHLVSKTLYDSNISKVNNFYGLFKYQNNTIKGDTIYLVKQKSIGVGQSYSTLFAFPQVEIENRIIPDLIAIRNSLLTKYIGDPDAQAADFQAKADGAKSTIYVSKLTSDDPNYGKSNNDPVFKAQLEDMFNGSSYRVFFPADMRFRVDTINYLNQSIQGWKNQIKANEEAKMKAVLLQNYSFQAGSPIEYSEAYSGKTTDENSFTILVGGNWNTSVDLKPSTGPGFELKIGIEASGQVGGQFTDEVEQTHSKGFTLSEEGNDYLSVDVCREANTADSYADGTAKTSYSSFIFKTKGGATSCPYEGARKTKYYKPGTILDNATVQIEVPAITADKTEIINVPSGKPAYLVLSMSNNSAIRSDRMFDLKIVDGSNPDGANLIMDGAPIGNGRSLYVPAGETLTKTLEIRKGAVMDYKDLRLSLQSQCQEDIAATVSFSVYFTPSCSEVNIIKPSDNWVYNTNLPFTQLSDTTKIHYMEVVLDGFDVNYDHFDHIELQYKSASEGDDKWRVLRRYFSDPTKIDESLGDSLIKTSDKGVITYRLELDDKPDQRFDLRAASVCKVANQSVYNYSTVKSGLKDMYNPRLFGNPLPANGILTVNDEIRLNFNEEIADGYLTDQNFEVTAVKNGSMIDGFTSVMLDGINDELTSEISRNWKGKNITVAMKVMAGSLKNATYFSHGDINNSLEFGVTSEGKMKVRVGNETFTSTETVPFTKDNWANVAFSIDTLGLVSGYYNDTEMIKAAKLLPYIGEGNVIIGRSINSNGDFFAGKFQNVKIWNKKVDFNTLKVDKDKYLSGLESNLMDYYPMNEAKGTFLGDRASGANLQMNGAVWSLPDGYSVKFNGADQYLKINTGSVVIDKTMDYTMEFWFKASKEQLRDSVTMISNGAGDGTDLAGTNNLFSIYFDKSVLTFVNNGVKQTVEGNYLDDNWHHYALSVNRNSGRGQICIDGKLNTYFDESNLGSISAANIYLGARGWVSKTSNQQEKIDHYFKGSIDEFRIWNLYKQELIVAQNNNKKLEGTEKGLMAYYPFETYVDWQGGKELVFSTADMRIVSDPARKVADGVVNGGTAAEVSTTDNSPVKNIGPQSKLLYDFVVNNDALIISLKEQPERIEKTIVTFTVDRVRDVNGNMLISPVKWSAYIDRNQLKWSDTEFNLEKQIYQPLEFTSQIVNNGGAMSNFTLENIPSWLSVTPSDGIINPASSVKIKFTVDEGLNVGTYNEMIYMRNDDNVVEALPINIRVMGEKPDWTVNPADYKYNMSVFGKLRLNNIFSNDKDDILAAFSKGKCVGVTNNTYDKANDMWYTFLKVYSNELTSTDNLEFRIWDASTAKIFGAVPSQDIAFVNDKVVGSGKTPVIFDGKEMFFNNIPIKSGWSWISFNLAGTTLADVNATLANGVWVGNDIVKNLNNFDSYSATQKKWIGTLSSSGGFNNSSMYMIHSSVDQVLSTNGAAINPKSLAIDVKGSKWNYISYLPTVNYTVKEAMAGYAASEGDIVKSQNQFTMYSTGIGWVGNLTYMETGKGYMLKRTGINDVSFTYPSLMGSLSNVTNMRKINGLDNSSFINNNYSDNMSIIAVVNGIQPNDKVLAYINNELRGVGESIEHAGTQLNFISVAGDEMSNFVRFALERDGKTIAYSSGKLMYTSNSVAGSLAKPFVIDFSKTGSVVEVSPNPFKDRLILDVTVEKGDQIEIVIYDVLGRLVHKMNKVTAADNYYQTEWDASDAKEGVYMVRVSVNGESSVHKVEKK